MFEWANNLNKYDIFHYVLIFSAHFKKFYPPGSKLFIGALVELNFIVSFLSFYSKYFTPCWEGTFLLLVCFSSKVIQAKCTLYRLSDQIKEGYNGKTELKHQLPMLPSRRSLPKIPLSKVISPISAFLEI